MNNMMYGHFNHLGTENLSEKQIRFLRWLIDDDDICDMDAGEISTIGFVLGKGEYESIYRKVLNNLRDRYGKQYEEFNRTSRGIK